MDFKINLCGRPIHHEGTRVGQHGKTQDGQKIFLDYSDPLYDEMAFTISVSILEEMDDVRMIAFRDKAKDLTVFKAEEFFRVLEGETDENHYYVHPEEYNLDDKQVAVKMWRNIGVYENQGEGFKLAGGKYDEIDDID